MGATATPTQQGTECQARFAARTLLDLPASTNFPWSKPAVLTESIDRHGANLGRDGRRFLRDYVHVG